MEDSEIKMLTAFYEHVKRHLIEWLEQHGTGGEKIKAYKHEDIRQLLIKAKIVQA